MKTFAIALFLLIGSWLAPVSAAEKAVIDVLNTEAQSLKSNAVVWVGWNATADKIFHNNETSWLSRTVGGAGPADLQPAKLPLAFLVWRFEGERTNSRRFFAYTGAIVGSTDERRIEALLGLQQVIKGLPDYEWDQMLAKAATPEWAFQQIRDAIAASVTVSTYSRVFYLLNRFASHLPEKLRQPSYNLVRQTWPGGPGNGDGETYFDMLLRIDRERARREIIPYYATEDLYTVELLNKYAGSNRMVADAARKWMAEATPRQKEFYEKDLRHLILFSDPETELKPTLERIRAFLRTQTKPDSGDELDSATRAVIELDSPATADNLADFATQPAIPIETRFDILDWLARRRYQSLPKIFAWWLREDDTGKHWLRNEAENKWGAYGKTLLVEGDRINAQREKK